MSKAKYSEKNKRDPKQKRQEPLSTSIGDLLKAKGEFIPKAKKEDAVEEPKSTGKSMEERLKDKGKKIKEHPVYFDMHEPEQEPVKESESEEEVEVKDGSWEEFASMMTEDPTAVKEYIQPKSNTKNKFTVHAEYITKEGTDKRVRTDTFITKE